jgi:hypothetical protein
MRQLGKRLPDHQKILSIMELILENFKRQNPVAGRIEALKTLTKLLLR